MAVTAGIREQDYAPDGRYKYSLEEILRPFEMTTGYIRAQYCSFYAFYGTEYDPDGSPTELKNNEPELSASAYVSFIANL